jgi:hypothetical protein
MPDSVMRLSARPERQRLMAVLGEFAAGDLADRMRLDAAVRVLVTARRLLGVAPLEAMAGPGAAVILGVVQGWDPLATTAAEHLDMLPAAQLDAFLAAAPGWATAVRAAALGVTAEAA